jgi:hypothetical protein
MVKSSEGSQELPRSQPVSIPRIALCALLIFVALGGLATAFAQDPPDITRTGTLPTFHPVEYRGSNAWFDPAYNGQGWSFSELQAAAGGTNTGIGVSYTYETGGAPTWLLLQGSWQRETNVRRILDGHPVAVLSGPVFDGLGGACPTCPQMNPSIAQRRYQAGVVRFQRPDVATVELDGITALSGEAALVPAELVLTRPLPDPLVGTWRFTRRSGQTGSTYRERNFDTHGCQLTITRVASPTTLNRFDAAPTSVPFWLPPSGAQVQWLRIDNGIDCNRNGSDLNIQIAYDPDSTANMRAIALTTATPVFGQSPIGGVVVASYTVSRTSWFFEIYLQEPDKLIIRQFGGNNPTAIPFLAEFLLTRAP